MAFVKVSLAEIEARLDRPFNMVEVAQIDDMAAYLYYCTGTVSWHRHLDEDELFLVWRGGMTVETSSGSALLGPWDLVVVPKGTLHRSGSGRRATVLLVQPRIFADRHNGDRHSRTEADGRLNRVSLSALARGLSPSSPVATIATVGQMTVTALWFRGERPAHAHARASEMLVVQSGVAEVQVNGDSLEMGQGELVVIPKSALHRLVSEGGAVALRFSHQGVDAPQGL